MCLVKTSKKVAQEYILKTKYKITDVCLRYAH